MNKPLIFISLGFTLIVAGIICYFARIAEGSVVPLLLCGALSVLGGLVAAAWDSICDFLSGIFPVGGATGDAGPRRPTQPQKPASASSDELRTVADLLRKQVDRLSAQVDGLGHVASSSELEGRVSSLQKVLVSTQEELKRVKASLADEKKLHESAEASNDVLRDNNRSLLDEQKRLKSELESVVDSRDKLVSTEADRLQQMVPAGLLDSSIGQSVKWCAEAAAKGDRVAAQIFASLQTIKAAQGDEEMKGLLLSSLDVLGQSLTRLSEREGYSPQQKCDVLSNWSAVLNEISGSRFTLIVPSIGARLNLNTMVSNGPAAGNVTAVHCWGVLNENRDIYSHAKVS